MSDNSNSFRRHDDNSATHMNKKIKVNNIYDETKDDDHYDDNKETIVSNILHNEQDHDEISVLTNISEPEKLQTLASNSVRKNNAFGVLLSTLFSTQNCNYRKKQLPTPIHNVSSLKVHPYLPREINYSTSAIQPNNNTEYIINSMYSIADFLNTRNVLGFESALKDICLNDCVLVTPALSKPIMGSQYVVEAFKSLLRCSTKFNFLLHSHEIKNVNGYTVITFQHNTSCK